MRGGRFGPGVFEKVPCDDVTTTMNMQGRFEREQASWEARVGAACRYEGMIRKSLILGNSNGWAIPGIELNFRAMTHTVDDNDIDKQQAWHGLR